MAIGAHVTTTAWPLEDGLYRSPLLSSLGFVAGSTPASRGSMAGSVFPLDEQERNRRSVARQLGFDDVVRVKQVHGDAVIRAPFGPPPGAAETRSDPPHADAVWTDAPGILLAISAADCVPILVADPDGPIGAAHAGWEGTSRRIAQRIVRTLVENGAKAERLVAAIGPSIGPCCYTIDEGRARTIRERLGADAADALRADKDGVVFDLWSANATQLAAAGVRTIELAGMCTRSSGADLWSFRARHERGPQGTGIAVLGRRR